MTTNLILNKTTEDAITFVKYKINFNNEIFYVKKFLDRNGILCGIIISSDLDNKICDPILEYDLQKLISKF